MARSLLNIVFNVLGYTAWGWGILGNAEDIKGWILFFVGLIFSYYKLKESQATIKGKELDNQLKKRDLNKHSIKKDKE